MNRGRYGLKFCLYFVSFTYHHNAVGITVLDELSKPIIFLSLVNQIFR